MRLITDKELKKKLKSNDVDLKAFKNAREVDYVALVPQKESPVIPLLKEILGRINNIKVSELMKEMIRGINNIKIPDKEITLELPKDNELIEAINKLTVKVDEPNKRWHFDVNRNNHGYIQSVDVKEIS